MISWLAKIFYVKRIDESEETPEVFPASSTDETLPEALPETLPEPLPAALPEVPPRESPARIPGESPESPLEDSGPKEENLTIEMARDAILLLDKHLRELDQFFPLDLHGTDVNSQNDFLEINKTTETKSARVQITPHSIRLEAIIRF